MPVALLRIARRPVSAALLSAALIMMAACGQSGALYFAERDPAEPPVVRPPATARQTTTDADTDTDQSTERDEP